MVSQSYLARIPYSRLFLQGESFGLFRPKPEVAKFYPAKILYLEVSLNIFSFLQRDTI